MSLRAQSLLNLKMYKLKKHELKVQYLRGAELCVPYLTWFD
jgi:hypothetical protein